MGEFEDLARSYAGAVQTARVREAEQAERAHQAAQAKIDQIAHNQRLLAEYNQRYARVFVAGQRLATLLRDQHVPYDRKVVERTILERESRLRRFKPVPGKEADYGGPASWNTYSRKDDRHVADAWTVTTRVTEREYYVSYGVRQLDNIIHSHLLTSEGLVGEHSIIRGAGTDVDRSSYVRDTNKDEWSKATVVIPTSPGLSVVREFTEMPPQKGYDIGFISHGLIFLAIKHGIDPTQL